MGIGTSKALTMEAPKRLLTVTSDRITDASSVSEEDVSPPFDAATNSFEPQKWGAKGLPSKHIRKRSGSTSSLQSVESAKRIVNGGISLGSSKATTGIGSAASLPHTLNERLPTGK